MGCSGSKGANAAGSKKKHTYDAVDDNAILTEAELAPLDPKQMELFQQWWAKSMAIMMQKGPQQTGRVGGVGGERVTMDAPQDPKLTEWMLEHTEEPHRKKWDEAAGTPGGLLDKAQLIEFLRYKVLGEDCKVATQPILLAWHAALASLNTETGESVSFDEFQRSKQIMHAWMNSRKAMKEAMAALGDAMEQLGGMGGMGAMMGAAMKM